MEAIEQKTETEVDLKSKSEEQRIYLETNHT